MGLDPRAWKGLQGLVDPLRLQAGQQIDFSSGLSPGLGVGDITGGIGAALSGAGSLNTVRGSGTGNAADPGQAAGAALTAAAEVGADPLALTAAGGLTRAIGSAVSAVAAQAAAAAVQAFGSTTAALGTSAALASAGVTSAPGAVSVTTSGAVPGLPGPPGGTSTTQPPPVDRRAVGYGFGVPLRPRRASGSVEVPGLVHERAAAVRRGGPMPPESNDVTIPPWRALPGSAMAGARGSCGHCGPGGRAGRACYRCEC